MSYRNGPAARNPDSLAQPVKDAIAARVVAVFNDKSRGEKPVARQPDGMFGQNAVAWRIHGDVTAMMVGGVASLLLQMLHPAVLAGVWDHSNFRSDMHGRLRRTARFIATTTYGSRDDAEAIITRVRNIHSQVRGTLPDGTSYDANDPALLAYVHVTETLCFLASWMRYAEPRMSKTDQNRYFAEMAQIATALGADPVPTTIAAASTLLNDMRPQLRTDARTTEVAQLILNRRASTPFAEPLQRLTMQAAVDLLPVWARQMHRLPSAILTKPLIRAGTLGVARTLRWVFT